MDPLRVALLAFTATGDPAANARRIRAGLDAAADAGAQVVLTPECALPGYPSAARASLADVDWCALADHEEALAAHARDSGVLLALGTASRTAVGAVNEIALCGPDPTARYRKQCLTPTDRGHFVAGADTLVVAHAGWRLGVAICFDLRFGDVFRRLAAAGSDAFLVCAHMAGPDPDPGTKAAVIPTLCAARAAEWATPLAFCNTAAADRYCDSGAWDARGVAIARLAEGLHVIELRPRTAHDAWYADLRGTHLARCAADHSA